MDEHVLAAEVVAHPAGRVFQRHAGHLNIFAIDKAHHERPAIFLVAKGGAISINRPLPGDRRANRSVRVNQAPVALLPDRVGEPSRHLGIIRDPGAPLQHGAIIEVKGDMRAQRQRSNLVSSGGHQDRAPSFGRSGINGALDEFRLRFG